MPAWSKYLDWAVETSFGVAASMGSAPYDFAGESLERKPVFVPIRPPRFQSAVRQVETRRSVAGSVDVLAGWENIGYLWRYLIDEPSTTGPASGYYTHVFSCDPRASLPSLTLQVPREQEAHRYVGCGFTGFSFSLTQGAGEFGIRVEVVGADEASAVAVPSRSESDFEPTIPIGDTSGAAMYVTLDDGSTSWTASVESIDFQARWNRELFWTPRQVAAVGITPGTIIGATCRFKWDYDAADQFMLDAFRNRTAIDVTIKLTATSGLNELKFELPNCMIDGRPPTVSGAGRGNIPLEMNLSAYRTTSFNQGGPFRVTLKNTTASYS